MWSHGCQSAVELELYCSRSTNIEMFVCTLGLYARAPKILCLCYFRPFFVHSPCTSTMALMPFISTESVSAAPNIARMEPYAQVFTSEAKKHRNPPPASRHRGVFVLPKAIPLFDMQRSAHNSLNISNFYQETRESVPLMLVKTITTDIQRKLQDNPDYVELLIRFYPKTEASKNPPKIISHYFIMPQTWVPKMYLGAVHLSINRHPVISIENLTIKGHNYLTINEVHWMFSEAAGPAERIRHSMQGAAAFICINGGTMKGIYE
jgi:hypothetical protein